MNVSAYVDKNKDRILSDIEEILKIPSISTLPKHQPDMERCVEWLKAYMESVGLQNTSACGTGGNPIVYGEWIEAGNNKPTILIYGHYDVQPADPLEEWKTPPFEPTVKDGKMFARGAADDKAQFMVHLAAVKYYMETEGKLPVNIKFMIEGEEEIGGPNLEDFIFKNKNLLSCNYALISDSHMLSETQPAIDYGLRGLAYFEIEVAGPEHDVHSGLYGGAIQNPVNALAYIIAKLKDENGRILVPKIYDAVRKVDEEERKMIKNQVSNKDIINETGVKETFGEAEFSLAERVGARPSLDVHGVWGGFDGEGSKTIIPAKAGCKVSIRLVPNMKSVDVQKAFVKYVKKITPKGVGVNVKVLAGGEPYLVDFRKPIMRKAGEALETAFGNKPVYLLSGGAIPVAEIMSRVLGVDTVLMGFSLPDDNLHAPNEKMNLNQIFNGIRASAEFMKKIG